MSDDSPSRQKTLDRMIDLHFAAGSIPMRNVFFASISAILMFICGSASAAGTCNGCRIKNIGSGPYYDGICPSGPCVFIAMEGAVTGKPGCSTNSYWHFVLNINTPSGKATFAQLLAAHTSGLTLNISGSNYCTLSPGGVAEDLHYITYP
jgi:hypothetical protein